MSLLLWILFPILLSFYVKVIYPLLFTILSSVFVSNLSENLAIFICFSLSVLTLAKFIDGSFHIYISGLFSGNEKTTNEIQEANYKFDAIVDETQIKEYYAEWKILLSKNKSNETLTSQEKDRLEYLSKVINNSGYKFL